MYGQDSQKKFQAYFIGAKIPSLEPAHTVEAEAEDGSHQALIKFIPYQQLPDGEKLARICLAHAEMIRKDFGDRYDLWPILDCGIKDTWLYFIERRTERLTLAEVLDLHGPIDAPSCLDRAAPLFRIISELHERGVICGFLNPDNIIIHEDGTFLLGDFLSPIFTFLHHRDLNHYLSMAAYLAPELIRSERIDARSDVFSIAGVLYRAVTGRNPFPEKTDRDPHWDLRGVPMDASYFGIGCNAHFAQVLRWAMSPDAAFRPAHPRRLLMDARAAFLEGEPLSFPAGAPAGAVAESEIKPSRPEKSSGKTKTPPPNSETPADDWVPPELSDVLPAPRPNRRRFVRIAVLLLILTAAAAAVAAALKFRNVTRDLKKPAAVASQCPEGAGTVAAGKYELGEDDAGNGVAPRHGARLSGFCIDRFEYPNAGNKTPDSGISWLDAERLCHKQGKRLCTENEWEAACRGPEGFLYPYGNKPVENICNVNSKSVAQSGRFAGCASPAQATDMSGNLMEWTSNWFETGRTHSLRGGSWVSLAGAKCTLRFNPDKIDKSQIGFRCCQDLKQ